MGRLAPLLLLAACQAPAQVGVERAAVESGVWSMASPTQSPTGRIGAAMAYDANRQVTVMFGGKLATYLDETWEYDGTTWTQRVTSPRPAPRVWPAMVFDQARGVSMLFGGENGGGVLGDQWTWDGTTWTPICATAPCSTNMPPQRGGHAMAYDGARLVTVLFGGYDWISGTLYADTWEWDGTSWAQRCTMNCSPPAARQMFGMAWDPLARTGFPGPNPGVVVIYGGLHQFGGVYGDCFEYTRISGNENWVPMSGGPSARADFPMVWDSARGRVVLYGGIEYNSNFASDTWERIGRTWVQTSPGGAGTPGGRQDLMMAYDSGRRRAVLFGGSTMATLEPGDTWEYHSIGAACVKSSDCDTGFCADGFCCDTACNGPCQSCAIVGGTCSPVKSANDADTCMGTSTCDASGACKSANGQPCGAATSCASGFCASGVCCATVCDGGSCQRCDGATQGWTNTTDGLCAIAPSGFAGTPSCSPATCDGKLPACANACNGDGQCGSAFYCGAPSTCQPRKASGATCVPADCFVGGCRECASGNCIDGVCCDSPCTEKCKSCNASGHCDFAVGRDPKGDCPGASGCAGTCAADGSCNYPAADKACDTCKACDGNGKCSTLPLGGDDPACGAISCAAFSMECVHYADRTVKRCVSLGLCAAANDPATCTEMAQVADGTACSTGVCLGGACVAPADGGSGAGKSGCSFGGASPSGGWLLLLLALVRRRRSR